MKKVWILFLLSCSTDVDDEPSVTSGGFSPLHCPGDIECAPIEGRCPTDQVVSPSNTCTIVCETQNDCPLVVSGETCLGGFCGVPCSGQGDGGCPRSGMPDATCVEPERGVFVCGYLQE